MTSLVKGQRWISEAEPELGIGELKQAGSRRICIEFPAADCTREYSLSCAPLKRVRFKPGDRVTLKNGVSLKITDTREQKGLIHYSDGTSWIDETRLGDTLACSLPEDRLLAGISDSTRAFDIRHATLALKAGYDQSVAKGFLGGQVDLLPHQFYIARTVTGRYVQRVLLSDETGLGKTIEACLILHRLLTTDRIERVLIIVPESLVHQWFVELFRKFNLSFCLFSRSHLQHALEMDRDRNPFEDDQTGIISLDLVREWPKLGPMIVSAGWDMVVIDEIHHIDPGRHTYGWIKQVAGSSPGLMLLSATPEQMGIESHFSHLQLLDPDRYPSLAEYQAESASYISLAREVSRMQSGQQSCEHLLDGYGPGRSVFRNTRAVIKGFPSRRVHLYPLKGTSRQISEGIEEFESDRPESFPDPGTSHVFSSDPRIALLLEILQRYPGEKILLISSAPSKTRAVQAALARHTGIKTARFDETMTLMQRDRNAAWFSEPDGARVLVCSEIGSEGRNFQFSRHLFLFDLPVNPGLLEQRIGRLDRIGQKNDIHIHVPYVTKTPYEVLARWYMEGMDLFSASRDGLFGIWQEFATDLEQIVDDTRLGRKGWTGKLDDLIKRTRTRCLQLEKRVKKGKNILLEMNSFRPGPAFELLDQIRLMDSDPGLERLWCDIMDEYDIQTDTLGNRTYAFRIIDPDDERFPLPATGNETRTVTFDRQTAVSRQDLEFYSLDHPYIRNIMDFICQTGKGNCCYARLSSKDAPGLLLETIFVLECVAPAHLDIRRFLPEMPIRCILDQEGKDVSGRYPVDEFARILGPDQPWLQDMPQISQKLLPGLLRTARHMAEARAGVFVKKGQEKIRTMLGGEYDRLEMLKKKNPAIRARELQALKDRMNTLSRVITDSRVRLDSLRLIRLF